FVVLLVADEQDRVTLASELLRLHVDLGDQRTGCVNDVQPALDSFGANRRRNSMSGEDSAGADGHLGKLFHENRPGGPQLLDYVPVVNDLLAHVDRRWIDIEGDLYNVDSTNDARAKT